MADRPETDRPTERVIDLSVEVAGTPEEVWDAIATGPGISSWYVPTTVEEHEGGATTSRFGEGPEMVVPGRVTAWEPPHRVVFEGADPDAAGLAFEWLVEASDGGSCVVRLVNSGFVAGAPWDDQYDGMVEGWGLFLRNLQLHRAHFPGQVGVSVLPTAAWPVSRDDAWARLSEALGLPAALAPGDRVGAGTSGSSSAPPLAGAVVDAGPGRLCLLLDTPAPGTAFVAAEPMGEATGVSVWMYLYGADAVAIAVRDEPRWHAWLAAIADPAG